MTKQSFTPANPAELRERGVRLFGRTVNCARPSARGPRPRLTNISITVIKAANTCPSDTPSGSLRLASIPRLAVSGIPTTTALAESIIGLFKTKAIKFLGPWKSVGQVEWETLKWVEWYNNARLHSAIGYITLNEADEAFYANLNAAAKAA